MKIRTDALRDQHAYQLFWRIGYQSLKHISAGC
jgi:hypothetical protein